MRLRLRANGEVKNHSGNNTSAAPYAYWNRFMYMIVVWSAHACKHAAECTSMWCGGCAKCQHTTDAATRERRGSCVSRPPAETCLSEGGPEGRKAYVNVRSRALAETRRRRDWIEWFGFGCGVLLNHDGRLNNRDQRRHGMAPLCRRSWFVSV